MESPNRMNAVIFNNLKVLKMNIQCLSYKLDVFESLLTDVDAVVVSVAEHWCSS